MKNKKYQTNHFNLRWLSIFALSVFLLTGGCSPQPTTEKYQLKFDENGKFKIVQFTDLHLTYGKPTLEKTLETVKYILAAEKPGLVVTTGDIILGEPDGGEWTKFARIFEEAETPFAITLGNHDAETNPEVTRSKIFDILSHSPYFVGEKGPEEIHGEGNYVLPVHGKNNKVAALLYCFDSNTYSSNPNLSGYQPVYFDQIAWYREQSKKYTADNDRKPLPALAFFHIPLPEYGLIADKLFPAAERKGSPGPSYNSGLFGSFLEMQDVMGVFVGHIHENDYIGIEKNIALAYGRVTGSEAAGKLECGARIIELYENEFMFDTWISTVKGVEQAFNYPTGITSTDEETMVYLPALQINPTKQGVAYTYYEGRFGTLKNIDPNKKVSEGIMKNISILEAAVEDNFAYEFRTLIRIPERGVYNFYTISDDDSQIFIDNQLVVNKPYSSIARVTNKVALEAGFHELKVLYYESSWGQFLEIGYASKNIRDQKIPNEILFIPENYNHNKI